MGNNDRAASCGAGQGTANEPAQHDPGHLYWRADELAKMMARHGIADRPALARRINWPRSTVHANLGKDWSGRVKTNALLAAMCRHFGVRMSTLVHEPKDFPVAS